MLINYLEQITLLQQSDTYDRLGIVETLENQAIVYSYIATSGIGFALIMLILLSVKMVSYGETTIESLLNMKERARLKKKGKVSLHFQQNFINFVIVYTCI